jgi:hypothetical protein
MTAAIAARRVTLQAGEVSAACRLLGLQPPPGFAAEPTPILAAGVVVDGAVHPAVAATLAAACAPQVGVVVRSDVGPLWAAVGVRGDLGGSLLRCGSSDVEVSTWRAARLGAELARTVPALGSSDRSPLHVPLDELASVPGLDDIVIGTLHATVVAPPAVLGVVVWLATTAGWLTLDPAEAMAGRRWADVRPVQPDELGGALAPFLAAALA